MIHYSSARRPIDPAPQLATKIAQRPAHGSGPLTSTPHDFRRLFITDAIMNGMPPHIAQLVVDHRDSNTTMGYKAVYPEEVINGHRAFIARRRTARPSEECRTPTDEEWNEFLGHFERRPGRPGRSWHTSWTVINRHPQTCRPGP
jgi:hypothetical protein